MSKYHIYLSAKNWTQLYSSILVVSFYILYLHLINQKNGKRTYDELFIILLYGIFH